MKNLLLSLAVLFSCSTAFGQREIISMDWGVVKEIVKEDPDDVRELVSRLSAPTLDTTLTYNDRIIAFYGQSLISNGREDALVDDMSKLFSQEDYANALIKAREALAVNPLNLQALDRAGMCIALLIESGDTSYSKDEAKQFFNRAMRIYNTIAMTGRGDEEYPFCVTSVADEYEFMRNYLELYGYESHAVVGICDVFALKETSEYYSGKKIYFDATRPLEMVSKALGE